MSDPPWYLRTMWPTAVVTVVSVYAWWQLLLELSAPEWDRRPEWWLLMLTLGALGAVLGLVALVWAGMRREA